MTRGPSVREMRRAGVPPSLTAARSYDVQQGDPRGKSASAPHRNERRRGGRGRRRSRAVAAAAFFPHPKGSDLIAPSAAEFDRALDRAVAAYTPDDAFTDPLLARRRVLPVSRPGAGDCVGGLGIRRRLDLMPCAFVGCLVRACEGFFDVGLPAGAVLPGCFPSLAVFFGGGAFDAGGHRFAIW